MTDLNQPVQNSNTFNPSSLLGYQVLLVNGEEHIIYYIINYNNSETYVTAKDLANHFNDNLRVITNSSKPCGYDLVDENGVDISSYTQNKVVYAYDPSNQSLVEHYNSYLNMNEEIKQMTVTTTQQAEQQIEQSTEQPVEQPVQETSDLINDVVEDLNYISDTNSYSVEFKEKDATPQQTQEIQAQEVAQTEEVQEPKEEQPVVQTQELNQPTQEVQEQQEPQTQEPQFQMNERLTFSYNAPIYENQNIDIKTNGCNLYINDNSSLIIEVLND